VARANGRTKKHFDERCQAKNFRTTDELLINFTAASVRYFTRCMPIGLGGYDSIQEFMEVLESINSPAHSVLFLTFYYLVPYCQFRKAVRTRDSAALLKLLPLFLQLFTITNKLKYARLTLMLMRTLEVLPPSWREAVWEASFGHISDDAFATGIDAQMEFVNYTCKKLQPVETRTSDQLSRTVANLNVTLPLIKHFEKEMHISMTRPNTDLLPTSTTAEDISNMEEMLGDLLGNTSSELLRDRPHGPLFDDRDTPFRTSLADHCNEKMKKYETVLIRKMATNRQTAQMGCPGPNTVAFLSAEIVKYDLETRRLAAAAAKAAAQQAVHAAAAAAEQQSEDDSDSDDEDDEDSVADDEEDSTDDDGSDDDDELVEPDDDLGFLDPIDPNIDPDDN
jgi:hypothetical protein